MNGKATNWKKRLKAHLKPWLKPVLNVMPPILQFHLFGRWRTPQSHDYLTPRQIEAARTSVRETMARFHADGIKTVYWFLPSQTWFSGSFQRPQQLARSLSETGCGVIYFEEWKINHMVHLTSLGTVAKGTVQFVEDNLWLSRCPYDLVSQMVEEFKPDHLILLWPAQESAMPSCLVGGRHSQRPIPTTVVYEVVDDPSLQPDSDKAWHAVHERWLRNADLVTVTADDLLSQISSIRSDALLLPNGVRLEDWRGASPKVPEDLIFARESSVVVGYYGALAGWFDWDMWINAATARPDWAFVLIGYPYLPEDVAKVEAANRLPNVHYLGKKPNRELAAYLHHFDVATIPFILNDITHACSPVKLFEYLAAGKPVVSTRMREVLKYDSLYLADDAGSFVAQIEEATRSGGSRDAAIASEAEANTWRARAHTLTGALERSEPSRQAA